MITQGSKVKVNGTNITGEVIEIKAVRNRALYGTNSLISICVVKEDNGKTMEYLINELRALE